MISVCIATYNGSKYIKEQLDSILIQLNDEDEIIISDDGSLDDTIEIIKKYNDLRIKLYFNSFRNITKNFEFAIEVSSGDYIFLADQDDIWANNKLEICMEELESGIDLILHDCSIFDSNTGDIVEPSFFSLNRTKKGFINNIIKNGYIGCCIGFNRKMLKYILPFPKIIPMHDIWIGIVAELFGKIKHNTNILILYRKHTENFSPTSRGSSDYSFMKKIGFRISTLIAINIRMFKIYILKFFNDEG